MLVTELYKTNMAAAAILLIDRRLASRATVYEWDGVLMGPARDITGFEQGGVNSSDFYKLYNNEQLNSAQESKLGVSIGSSIISAIGQADDVILASNNLHSLQMLVFLTEQYCLRYRVKLEPTKTRLLVYHAHSQSFQVEHAINSQQITINSIPVKLASEVEHVGVLRSTTGNQPHIQNRVTMFNNAVHALFPAGLARRHRGNPIPALKLAQLYAVPVLLAGLASLVLSQKEMNIIDGHYLKTLQRLLRLHDRSPRSIIYYLAGSLPACAIIHKKQMTLFSMICHLRRDPLNSHAYHVLLQHEKFPRSWFIQIRLICLLYGLPHPLQLLENPPTRLKLKSMVKTRITSYWQGVLAEEAFQKHSLRYFNPTTYDLTRPHPLWAAAGSSAYEVNKATVLARMLSGRYRTESLCRFWSDNRQGYCMADTCLETVGDLEHLLLHCPALQGVRDNLLQMWLSKAAIIPDLLAFVGRVLMATPTMKMAFILDPLSMPELAELCKHYGDIIFDTVAYMGRTYVYGLHRKKLILMGKWPYATKDANCVKDKDQLIKSCVVGTMPRRTCEGSSTTRTCSTSPRHDEPWPYDQEIAAVRGPDAGQLHANLGQASSLDHLSGLVGDSSQGGVHLCSHGSRPIPTTSSPITTHTMGSPCPACCSVVTRLHGGSRHTCALGSAWEGGVTGTVPVVT